MYTKFILILYFRFSAVLFVICLNYSTIYVHSLPYDRILTKLISLIFLHSMKPSFSLFGGILFFQTSLGFIFLSNVLDFGETLFPTTNFKMVITLSPFISSTLTLIYYRMIWDRVRFSYLFTMVQIYS